MANITALTHLQSIAASPSADPAAGRTSQTSATVFADLLNQAVSPVSATEAATRSESLALLTGSSQNIHNVVLSAEKAEVALRLTLQVRNKVLDAYNEIMRMQV